MFDSYKALLRNKLWQVVHTLVPVIEQYKLVPAGYGRDVITDLPIITLGHPNTSSASVVPALNREMEGEHHTRASQNYERRRF